MEREDRMIDFVSAFAGIGGFERGFELAGGFRCTAQIEWKKDRLGVLAEHFDSVPQFGDITEVTGAEIISAAGPDIDLMVGGFPCQDTSIGAPHREGLDGSRSSHFWEFERLVYETQRLLDDVKPTWALIENPTGLLTSRGGRDMEAVLRALVELGYGVSFRVLDASLIPGSAGQRRQRVLLLGHLSGDPRPAAQVLALGERGSEDPDVGDPRRSSARRPQAARSAEDHGGRLIFRKSRRPRSKEDYATYVSDDVVNTLNGYDGGFSARQTNVIIDHGRPRVLTQEEWEMAQGFEPGWTASMKEGARWQAIGDSMNVHHARWLGERLAAVHESLPLIGAST
jgi:DNA-cytosine methyltransferase